MKNSAKLSLVSGILICLVFTLAMGVHAQDKYVLRLGHFQATTHPVGVATDDFAKNVKERSNGQLEIQVFPAAQIGDTPDLIQALKLGTVDMVWIDTSQFDMFVPEMNRLLGGYLYRDREHMFKVMKGQIGDELKEKLLKQAGMRILTYHYNGERHVTTSNKPIHHAEDLKGVLLRVPGNDAFMSTFKALGASIVGIAYNEVYMALKTGVAEGQENPFSSIYAMKFHEVQKYLMLTGHMIQTGTYTINEGSWKKLPENLQQILREEAEKAGEYCGSIYMKEEKELIPILKQYMTFIEVDKAEFQKAAEEGGMIEWFHKKLGPELYTRIKETK